jgi:hypothetical protein
MDTRRGLERALVAAGGRVLRVAPKLMGASRRAYLQGRQAEGRTRLEAMRRLERHLARGGYWLLSDHSRRRIEYRVYPGVR